MIIFQLISELYTDWYIHSVLTQIRKVEYFNYQRESVTCGHPEMHEFLVH